MSHIIEPSEVFFYLSLGFLLITLCGIIAVTIRISLRLNKVDAPKLRWLLWIALLQILLGVISIIIESIFGPTKEEALIAFVTPLGATLLSGILFIKLILKTGWKQSLRVWGLAAAMQLVLLPVCSFVLFIIYVMLLSLFPNLTPWKF
jgi:hypothetical protein